jgi:hypothetical protein
MMGRSGSSGSLQLFMLEMRCENPRHDRALSALTPQHAVHSWDRGRRAGGMLPSRPDQDSGHGPRRSPRAGSTARSKSTSPGRAQESGFESDSESPSAGPRRRIPGRAAEPWIMSPGRARARAAASEPRLGLVPPVSRAAGENLLGLAT